MVSKALSRGFHTKDTILKLTDGIRLRLGLDFGRSLNKEDDKVGHGHGCTASFHTYPVLVEVIAAVSPGQVQGITIPTRVNTCIAIRNVSKAQSTVHLPGVANFGTRSANSKAGGITLTYHIINRLYPDPGCRLNGQNRLP